MDPPAFDETYGQSINSAIAVEYPAFVEGEECVDGSSDDNDTTFATKGKCSYGDGSLYEPATSFHTKFNCSYRKIAAKKRRRRKREKLSRKDLRLANRTSKILTNYRDFLLEHEMNSPHDDGFRDFHYYDEHETKTPTTSNRSGEEATCLLREFSQHDAGGYPKEAAGPDIPLGSNDDGPAEKDYEMTVLHSKRVRYGILMSFAVPTIIVLVIIACAKASYEGAMPARENTSGWHNEAAYLLEHEDEDKVEELRHHIAGIPWNEAMQKDGWEGAPSEKETDPEVDATETAAKRAIPSQPEEKNREEATANVAPKDAEVKLAPVANTNLAADFDLEKLLHRKFKPLWLGPREGWTGGSHDEATQFCQSIRGKELCPYSAMCPYGPGKNVMAGRHPVDFSSQGEQYAPIYGHANRWIMVGQKNGDASTTCMSHEQLEGRPPHWGLSGDRAEFKSHIMCCSVPTQGL